MSTRRLTQHDVSNCAACGLSVYGHARYEHWHRYMVLRCDRQLGGCGHLNTDGLELPSHLVASAAYVEFDYDGDNDFERHFEAEEADRDAVVRLRDRYPDVFGKVLDSITDRSA